jgi:hypothetical protein
MVMTPRAGRLRAALVTDGRATGVGLLSLVTEIGLLVNAIT